VSVEEEQQVPAKASRHFASKQNVVRRLTLFTPMRHADAQPKPKNKPLPSHRTTSAIKSVVLGSAATHTPEHGKPSNRPSMSKKSHTAPAQTLAPPEDNTDQRSAITSAALLAHSRKLARLQLDAAMSLCELLMAVAAASSEEAAVSDAAETISAGGPAPYTRRSREQMDSSAAESRGGSARPVHRPSTKAGPPTEQRRGVRFAGAAPLEATSGRRGSFERRRSSRRRSTRATSTNFGDHKQLPLASEAMRAVEEAEATQERVRDARSALEIESSAPLAVAAVCGDVELSGLRIFAKFETAVHAATERCTRLL
jgi:hypothetical protein